MFNSSALTWDSANLYASPFYLRGSSAINTITLYANFAVPASKTATLYMPVFFKDNNEATDYWNITVQVNSTNRPVIKKTLNSDASYERGKMYAVTLNVN